MVIDLTELEEGETSWRKRAEPEEIDLAFPDYSFSEPVYVQLRITHGETQYIVRGQITTAATTECVKCLTLCNLPIAEHVDWVVQIGGDPKVTTREEESEDFWFIEKGCPELDIADRVRETILVGLPGNPVCREDCRGLCPHCGADLNEGPCDCSTEKIDSRWGPLKDILTGKKNSSGSKAGR